MRAAMSFLSKATLFSFLLINTCQSASSFIIRCPKPPALSLNGPLDEEKIGGLRKTFDWTDQNHDGTWSKHEFMYPLSQDVPLVQRVFSVVDSNGNGKFDFPEFIELLNSTKSDEGLVRLGIKVLDTSNDGSVSKKEMIDGLKMIMDAYGLKDSKLEEYVNELFATADADKDGTLTLEEAQTIRDEMVTFVTLGYQYCNLNVNGHIPRSEQFQGLKHLVQTWKAV